LASKRVYYIRGVIYVAGLPWLARPKKIDPGLKLKIGIYEPVLGARPVLKSRLSE